MKRQCNAQRSPWTRRTLTLLMAAVSTLALAGSSLADAAGCQQVHGHFITRPVVPDLDGDPNTLEFSGPMTGTLSGTFLSTELRLIPVVRQETPNVFPFTELLDITTRHGTVLRTTGVGSFDIGSGLFTEILTAFEKDGVLGNFGQIFLFGVFNAEQGIGEGDYQGEVCD